MLGKGGGGGGSLGGARAPPLIGSYSKLELTNKEIL